MFSHSGFSVHRDSSCLRIPYFLRWVLTLLSFLKTQGQRLTGRFYNDLDLPAAFSVGSFFAQNGFDKSSLAEFCGRQSWKQVPALALKVDDLCGKELVNG